MLIQRLSSRNTAAQRTPLARSASASEPILQEKLHLPDEMEGRDEIAFPNRL